MGNSLERLIIQNSTNRAFELYEQQRWISNCELWGKIPKGLHNLKLHPFFVGRSRFIACQEVLCRLEHNSMQAPNKFLINPLGIINVACGKLFERELIHTGLSP